MKTIDISIDDLRSLLDELRELEQLSMELSSENDYLHGFVTYMVSASKEGVVLFPPPIDILGKTNIF